MATNYPVLFNVERPEKFERPQVVLRILVIIILSVLAGALGWIFGLVYLGFPVIAAIFISQKGGEKYLQDDAPKVIGWLRWVLALYSYLWLLTEKFPTAAPETIVKYEVQTGGTPTVGSALLRLILAIPSAFVLALLSIVGAIIWIIAVIMVLIQETYPEGMYNFQLGIMRWQARLLAYIASLVDPYPPFALDTGPEAPGGATAPAPQA